MPSYLEDLTLLEGNCNIRFMLTAAAIVEIDGLGKDAVTLSTEDDTDVELEDFDFAPAATKMMLEIAYSAFEPGDLVLARTADSIEIDWVAAGVGLNVPNSTPTGSIAPRLIFRKEAVDNKKNKMRMRIVSYEGIIEDCTEIVALPRV